MLIKHITAFAAVAIVTLLAGCTKSSIEESGPNDGLADLELSYVGASETRAAIDGTTFPRTGKIGLFLFKDEAATAPYATSDCKNVEYSYNNGSKKWTASPSIKVCLLVPSGDISSRQAVNLTLTIDDKDKTVSLSSDDGIIIAHPKNSPSPRTRKSASRGATSNIHRA